MKMKLVSSALLLCSAVAQTAYAGDAKFDQSITDKCVIDGAAEWRAQMDEPTAAEQELLDLERLACYYLAARKIDKLVEVIVADNGMILLDGAGVAQGKEAQRQLFKDYIAAGFDLAWDPVDATISEAGDMAWGIGLVRVTAPDGTVDYAKYTSVWENIDGTWMNIVEMRNSNGELGSKLF